MSSFGIVGWLLIIFSKQPMYLRCLLFVTNAYEFLNMCLLLWLSVFWSYLVNTQCALGVYWWLQVDEMFQMLTFIIGCFFYGGVY